jgi:hypothetical protein
MHGKWGMNYKYHARAVVFNEKHLLRLWDVAFNGYTGGMGVKMVKWATDVSMYNQAVPAEAVIAAAKTDKDDQDRESWQQATVALDEPMRPNIADMFVMSFYEDEKLDCDLPNPINFSSGNDRNLEPAAADPDNLFNTHLAEMDVFKFDGANGCSQANATRYTQYRQFMPNYATMHAGRKTAGHASHEGDTHVQSLAFSGTMIIKDRSTGVTIKVQHGTGHLGDSFDGSASIRAGNGSMAASSRPELRRLV